MLRPPPQLTVSEWAERHRMLGSRASAEPGPWRTSRTPYLKDVMDALSAVHPARRVVFMKGAQVGATESGNNWLGYIMHHVPAPALAVQPTVELAKRFSRQRIDPLLEETPALRERVAPARARDSGNTMLSKEFPGGILVLTGANSAVGLRSMTARFLFLDEVDAYPGDVAGEGDPIALAEARARTFGWRRKAFLVSTPTIAGRSRIEREYLASDQRRFFVPCTECGEMQWLRFERLLWHKGAPETARYHCSACDHPMQEHDKTAMLGGGEWRATVEGQDPHTIGFHISALYSPVGWLSWEQIARDWEAAQGKPEDIKTFKNTVLGETWQEQGEAPDWERLVERREDFAMSVVPPGALVLTAGVDVQDDRLECDVWGWAEGFSSWLVDHVVIPGSPRDREPWDDLAKLLARDWPRQGGGAMRIARLCVDTGGRDTAAVYGHLRRLRESFEPGMILYRRGMGSVEVVNPSGGGSHAAFARRALEGSAVGTGLTYDQVAGDLTQANYSSLRAGKIEFRRLCEQVQYGMLIPMLVRPIADRFHAQGALLGLWGAEVPDGLSHVPPAHEMIDPLKDTTALIAQVRAGFVPQPEAVGAFGYDFRQVVEMIREANALLDEAGLSLDSDPRRVAKSGAAQDAAQLAAIEIAATGAASPRADAGAAPGASP